MKKLNTFDALKEILQAKTALLISLTDAISQMTQDLAKMSADDLNACLFRQQAMTNALKIEDAEYQKLVSEIKDEKILQALSSLREADADSVLPEEFRLLLLQQRQKAELLAEATRQAQEAIACLSAENRENIKAIQKEKKSLLQQKGQLPPGSLLSYTENKR